MYYDLKPMIDAKLVGASRLMVYTAIEDSTIL